MSFVHLHTHSHYSLLKSSTSVKALVKRVKSLGMKSVALTDRGNMYGAVEFYFEAKKEGLNPILGVEIALADEVLQLQENPRNPHNPYSLILLARTYKGYQNLSSIVSFAHKENIVDGMPRATFDILQQHGEDLICLSGGPFEGFGPCLFKSKNDEIVLEQLSKLKEIFKNQFYLEVFQHSTSEYGTALPSTALLSTALLITALLSTALLITALLSTALLITALPSTALLSTALPSTALPSTALPSTALLITALLSTALLITALLITALPSTALLSTALPSTALPSTALLNMKRAGLILQKKLQSN